MRIGGRLGGRSQWSVHPTLMSRGGRGLRSPVCVGAWHQLRRRGLSRVGQSVSEPEVALFTDLSGTVTPALHHQVCLGIWGQGGGRNLETLAPGTLFARPSHFTLAPALLARGLQWAGLRTPRTWPKSADAGMFLGEAPGGSWVPAGGEKKHLYLRANLLPVWPYPRCSDLAPPSSSTLDSPTNARALEWAGKPGQNEGEGGGNCRFLLVKILVLPNKTFSRRNSNLKDRMLEDKVAEHMFCPIGKVGSSFLLYCDQQNFPFGLPAVGKHSNGSDLKSSLLRRGPESFRHFLQKRRSI